MSSYFKYLCEFEENLKKFREIKIPTKRYFIGEEFKKKSFTGDCVMLFSPHPDDEVITGLLPLRLSVENSMKVVNVAMTLGSDQNRVKERLNELEGACDFLSWQNHICFEEAFKNIKTQTKTQNSAYWQACIQELSALILKFRPKIVIFPHSQDANSTHKGVHLLVMDTLKTLLGKFEPLLIQSQYWRPIEIPNLLIEANTKALTDLLSALSYHTGELERSDYLARLPSYFVDNVRLASESMSKEGSNMINFNFGASYLCGKLDENANFVPAKNAQISMNDDICDFISL